MAKIDIDIVKVVLQRAELGVQKTAQIIEDINFESKSRTNEDGKERPCKKQFVFIASDPHGDIAKLGKNFSGWVVQIPENDNQNSVIERINKATYDFNATPKGRRMPLKNLAEACGFMPKKLQKDHKIWVKTKEPILVVTSNGKISNS